MTANQVVPFTPAAPVAPPSLVPQNLTVAMDLAKMMAGAALVPQHLQNKPADCLLVIEQAVRWGMSPFAVAQATSVISGKLMYEGKLVAAAINASGILSKRLSYTFSGEGPARQVKVLGTIRGEDEPREVLVVLKDVKTNNSMWTKQIDQQLTYSGARVWARRHLPEVMLGVYTPDEFDEPRGNGSQAVLSPPPAPSESAVAPNNDAEWIAKIENAGSKAILHEVLAAIAEAKLGDEAELRLLPYIRRRKHDLAAAAQETIHVPESRQGRQPLPKHDPETGEIDDEAGIPEHMRSEHDMPQDRAERLKTARSALAKAEKGHQQFDVDKWLDRVCAKMRKVKTPEELEEIWQVDGVPHEEDVMAPDFQEARECYEACKGKFDAA